MATNKGFATLLSIADELREELERLNRVNAENLLVNLTIATPKLTGAATGEWQVTINERATSLTDRKDLTGTKTANAGISIINRSKSEKYPDIWVSNLIDYITYLNDGSSDQAPAKFIETAEREALASVR